jgi:hypothetical protein
MAELFEQPLYKRMCYPAMRALIVAIFHEDYLALLITCPMIMIVDWNS